MKRFFTFSLLMMLLVGGLYAQTARVQVIHNSADAAAATVDVYLTVAPLPSLLLIDDFAFRTASSFIDAPAGSPLQIGVAPGNSTSVNDTIANFNLTLTANETYVVVANGIVSPSGYSPAPAFGLDIFASGQEAAATMGNTDVLVVHGSTDAPTVDVVEVGAGAGTIVDDASYQDFAGYLNLPTADYSLQVRTGEGNTTVAQFGAPLSTLSLTDSALVVVASGFLDPMANSMGAPFGLFVALPGGGALIPLPSEPISTARAQVIHNCADAAAATVDVWLNDALLLDDFDFRTASPFVDAPAGTPFDITIAAPTSTDTTNPVWRNSYTLTGGEKYILVADGIVSATGYTPAPAFDLSVYQGALEQSVTGGNVSVLVHHGSTDAPMVDVEETGVPAGVIVDDISYPEFDGYLDLGTLNYTLAINASSNNQTVVSYEAPLSSLNLADNAITVVASGFLDPTANSNGEGFGLWVALTAGGALVPLSVITKIEDQLIGAEISLFPNPTTDLLNVNFSGLKAGQSILTVTDLNGRQIAQQNFGTQSGTSELQMDLSNVPAGLYMINLQQGEYQISEKIQVIH